MDINITTNRFDVTELKNKFDAFRMFKTLCEDFGYEHFCVFDVTRFIGDFSYNDALVLHTLGDVSISLLDGGKDPLDDPIIKYMSEEIIPRHFDQCEFDETRTPQLMRQLEMRSLTAVPLSSISGRRYALVYLHNHSNNNEDIGNIGLLVMQSIDAFQKFFNAVLSKELSADFTRREVEIIQKTADGKTSVEIAKALGISEHTVNSDMAGMLKKVNANNRAHLITLAIKRGIIQ